MKPKQQKREEAEVRNAKWQNLSTKDKIASLKARRGGSVRQLSKLEAK